MNIEFLRYILCQWDKKSKIIERRLQHQLNKQSHNNSLPSLLYIYLPLISQLAKKHKNNASESFIKLLQDVLIEYYFPNLLFESNFLHCTYRELSKVIDGKLTEPIINDFVSQYPINKPSLLGFSLIAETQLPFAILLSRLIKSQYPNTVTVIGGAYITEILIRPNAGKNLFLDFDYLVAQEGESALVAIINCIKTGQKIDHPNVFKKNGFEVRPLYVEPIDSLPSPDFSGLKLDHYFSNDLNLPIFSSKGCSWGRCKFCSQNILSYREKKIEHFALDIQHVIEQTGITHFQITDENITPSKLHDLSLNIIKLGLNIRWFIQIRFDNRITYELLELMKKAGCYAIEFGLETGSPFMLKKIQKGISLRNVDKILKYCFELDYTVVLNCMVGFPEETPELAEETILFLNSIETRFPNLRLSCNTQTVKIYTTARYATMQDIVYKPYPLSTVAKWSGPTWVNEFRHRYANHIMFSGQTLSSRNVIERYENIDENLPRFKLSKNCFLIKNVRHNLLTNLPSSNPLDYLVRMKQGTQKYEIFSVNNTMVSLIETLGNQEFELITVRDRFYSCYKNYETDNLADAFEKGILRLNEIGALSVC